MRIEFSKRMEGKEALGDYIRKSNPIECDRFTNSDRYIVTKKCLAVDWIYSLKSLTEKLMTDLEESFKANRYDVLRTAQKDIWVSGPEKFSISLTKLFAYDPPREYYQQQKEIVDGEEVRDLTMPKKGVIRTKDLPLVSFTPYVDVQGSLNYARLDTIDPIPHIQLLQGLGYSGKVIPAPTELLEILNAMNAKLDALTNER